MIEYLSPNECDYLIDLIEGYHRPVFWSDDARAKLVAKLGRLKEWAIKEDDARARLKGEL